MTDQPFLPQILGLPSDPISILDVGALNTGTDRYALLEKAGAAQVTAVELNPDAIERLKQLFPDRSFIPYALGDGSERTIHFCKYSGCTSLYRPDPKIIDRFTGIGASTPDGNFFVQGTEPIRTKRLDDIPNLPAFDFLKLDVQGAELDVLKGGERTLRSALLVETETEFVPIYENQPLFADIDSFLRARGFVFHKFIDFGGRAYRPFWGIGDSIQTPLSQLLWADAIYIRDISYFNDAPDSATIKAATLLHDIYRSYDLAAWLLQNLDNRKKTRWTEIYVAHLQKGKCLPPIIANINAHIDSVQ